MAAPAAAAVLLVALVAEDPAVLRNAPRDDAPAQAALWRGDWLEVRGESAGFLRVWDHRRERPGYVRPQAVRVHRADAASAPELAAVVRFLRDSAGNESLGIGYAALALRAAPAGADVTEILAAIGTMADRLARRASARRADPREHTLAAHVEVAESYGVKFRAVAGDGGAGSGSVSGNLGGAAPGGRARICYDGEAWERVLAAPAAAPVERARAALFLAGAGCPDSVAVPAREREWNDRRVQALQSVDAGAAAGAGVVAAASGALPAFLAARVRLRLAEALAWRAFDLARQGQAEGAARAEAAAVRELALADRGVLAPEDVALHDEASVRVAASRWAADAAPPEDARRAARRPAAIALAARAPGETCVRVVAGGAGAAGPNAAAAPKAEPLAERCTYGVVWQSALRWAPSGTVATLVVQPLPAWTELWVVRRGAGDADSTGWTIDVLTPATTSPEVGYVEAAGFSPDGARLLVAREARVDGRVARRFQVLVTPTLAVDKQATTVDKLLGFKRWSAPSWRAATLALR